MGDPAALSAGAAATAPEAGAPLAVGVADAELPVGEGFELVRVMVGALAMAALAWAGVMVVVLGGTELTLLVLFVELAAAVLTVCARKSGWVSMKAMVGPATMELVACVITSAANG